MRPMEGANEGLRSKSWSCFATMWALAMLADRVKRGSEDDLLGIAVGIAALLVMAAPGLLGSFALLSVTQLLWYLLGYYEKAMVHWHLAATLHAAFLLSLLESAVRGKFQWAAMAPRIRQGTASFGKFLLAFGFFMAGFAKLNHDFFDPELSCGVIYYRWLGEVWLFGKLVPMSPFAQSAASYFSAVLEILGPLLLLFRRTQGIGLALCWTMHIALGANPRSHYFEFSGLFFAMGIPFLPPRVFSWLDVRKRFVRLWSPLGAFLLSILFIVSFFGARDSALEVLRVIWLAAAFLLLAVLLGALLKKVPRTAPTNAGTPRMLVLPSILALLVVFNEVSPYVGLDHSPTLTMAANLRLTPHASNHLIVREVPTFSWSQPVEIHRSTVKGLSRGASYPWMAFADRMSQADSGTVRFSVDGKKKERARAGDPRFERGRPLARILRLGAYKSPRGQRTCDKPPPGLSGKQWRKEVRRILERRKKAAKAHLKNTAVASPHPD